MKRVILMIFISFALLADTVELRDGRKIFSKEVKIQGTKVICADTTVQRKDVKRIIVGGFAEKKSKSHIGSDVKDILNKAQKAVKKYPNAGGIVLLDEGEWELKQAGIREYKYHFQGIILKDKEKKWATRSIWVEEDEEKAEILYARVIKPNGKVIFLPKSSVKLRKPKMGSVFFGKGKILTFTLSGVECGDIVEYAYKEDIFHPWDIKIFDPDWYFGGNEPVLYSSVKIKIPASQSFYYKLLNMKKAKKYTVDSLITNTTKIYTFTASDIPPYVEEPQMPPKSDIIPKLAATNQKNWDYIFTWYANFQKKRMVITPEIQSLADSITKGLNREQDKIAAIYYWVQQNIRYISIKGAASSGVSGHSATETLHNGFGDCTDKSILFSTLLRAVKVTAYPIYINTNDAGMLVKDIPSFYGNHCITEVFFKNGKHIILDATGSNSRYPSFWSADCGVWAVNAQRKELLFIKPPPPENMKREYNYNIKVKKDKSIYVNFTSHYVGDYESGIRWYWKHIKPDEKKLRMEAMVKDVSPNATLDTFFFENLKDISKPLIMHIMYHIQNFVQSAGDIKILYLPEISKRYRFKEISLEKRQYPLVYESPKMIVHHYGLEFSYPVKLDKIPENLRLAKSFAGYVSHYKRVKNTITFTDTFQLKQRIIPISTYSIYKNLINRMKTAVKKPILLEEK